MQQSSKSVPSVSVLQQYMCQIWGTTPSTTKLLLFQCDDWTNEPYQEDIYIDIRAYGMIWQILQILKAMHNIYLTVKMLVCGKSFIILPFTTC